MVRKGIIMMALAASAPSAAQNINANPKYQEVRALAVPVIEGDVTDRPYRVIGNIVSGIRKATVFSGSVSREKVFSELWERGRKLGADAVVQAQFGESKITAWSWGTREIRGVAIKFLTDEEIAALQPATSTAVSAVIQ